MLPPLRAVYTRILLRRMYYGHSGIRINTAFVSALLESNLLSLCFFLFFFRNFSGGFVNFAQRMFLTERNSGVPAFFWTFSEFSQKRNRLAFAPFFFPPSVVDFSYQFMRRESFVCSRSLEGRRAFGKRVPFCCWASAIYFYSRTLGGFSFRALIFLVQFF